MQISPSFIEQANAITPIFHHTEIEKQLPFHRQPDKLPMLLGKSGKSISPVKPCFQLSDSTYQTIATDSTADLSKTSVNRRYEKNSVVSTRLFVAGLLFTAASVGIYALGYLRIVLNIFLMLAFFSLLFSIIFSIIGIDEIHRSKDKLKGIGFALVPIIGLLVCTIVFLFVILSISMAF